MKKKEKRVSLFLRSVLVDHPVLCDGCACVLVSKTTRRPVCSALARTTEADVAGREEKRRSLFLASNQNPTPLTDSGC